MGFRGCPELGTHGCRKTPVSRATIRLVAVDFQVWICGASFQKVVPDDSRKIVMDVDTRAGLSVSGRSLEAAERRYWWPSQVGGVWSEGWGRECCSNISVLEYNSWSGEGCVTVYHITNYYLITYFATISYETRKINGKCVQLSNAIEPNRAE